MPNRFVLVNIVTRAVTDMDKSPLHDLNFKQFAKEYNTLCKTFKTQGGCEASVIDKNGDTHRDRNTPQAQHGEENLLINAPDNSWGIKAALIVIEPCYDHRYGNAHNCNEFFRAAGRTLQGKTRMFTPLEKDTPVFYLESQPRKGSTSQRSSALARMSKPAAQEALQNSAGPPWGQDLTPPAKNSKTQISGQEYMAAEEIVFFMKKSRVIFSSWNSVGCEADVIADVEAILSGKSASTSQDAIGATANHILGQTLAPAMGHIAGQAFGLHK